MSIDAAFTHFPALTTKRLHLRQLQPTDAEALFAIRSDREVMDFYGEEPHQSLADTHTLIQQVQDAYERREAILWGIALKGEDTIIGSCTFFAFGPGLYYAETGYELHRAYWRWGIMLEALPAILTYGFSELGLHRIEAAVDPRNTSSKSLLLKLGFTYEGNLRQRFFFRDQFLDAHYFGLLKDEWLNLSEREDKTVTTDPTNIRFINPATLAAAPGYSHVVEVTGGRTIFIAGQVALDPSGKIVGRQDFRAQTQQVFENLKAALAAVGTDFTHVVKLNMYVVDISQLPTLREVRDHYVNTVNPPASTLVEVRKLAREDFLIEVEAVAHVAE